MQVNLAMSKNYQGSKNITYIKIEMQMILK